MSSRVQHPPLDVTATYLDEDGAGVGLAGGFVLHVADLLPGERALVKIAHVGGNRRDAWGHIAEALGDASPDRVAPACGAFGQCGGCAWQHLDYPAACAEKRRIVREALEGLLPEGVEVAEVRTAPALLGYRNRAKFVVAPGGRDRRGIALGAYAPRSHTLVETTGCRVIEPVLVDLAKGVRRALAESGLRPYDEKTRKGDVRYVLMRTGEGGDVGVVLVTAGHVKRSAMDALAQAIKGLPRVAGVLWSRNDSEHGVILGETPVLLVGRGTVRETLSGVAVDTHAQSFFQVNRAQAAALYAFAAKVSGAGAQTRALELYSGSGGISFALAARGAAVLGLELDAQSVASATEAAVRANLGERVRFRTVDAGALDAAALEALRAELAPGLVVVNPPRKGLVPAALSAICTLAPEAVLYVSCSPQSLARDLGALREHGYTARSVTPFDLMPGTGQVETVVVLHRKQ